MPANKWRILEVEETSKGGGKKKKDKVCLLDTNNLETPLHFFRELLHIMSISSWYNHSLDTST